MDACVSYVKAEAKCYENVQPEELKTNDEAFKKKMKECQCSNGTKGALSQCFRCANNLADMSKDDQQRAAMCEWKMEELTAANWAEGFKPSVFLGAFGIAAALFSI